MSDPTDEERECIASGLRVLGLGGVADAEAAGGYRLSKGIAVADLSNEALWSERPLSGLVRSGRRFIGASSDTVVAFDLAYGEGGPSLSRAAVGPLAEATLDALADAAEAKAEDLVVVRIHGLSGEGLWTRDGGDHVTTILPANGAVEGEDFIEAGRRLTGRGQ